MWKRKDTNLDQLRRGVAGTLTLVEEDIEVDPVEARGDQRMADAQVKSLEAETRIKLFLSNKTYSYLKWWTRFVCLVILLAGFKSLTGFDLSDTVMVVVVGSTTASVIGLLLAMITGLFGGKKIKDSSSDK